MMKVKQKLPKNSWTEGIGFYIDGASFAYKANSFDQVIAPKATLLIIPNLGPDFAFIAKEGHERTGSVGHFMTAIVYRKGVIAAEQYHDRSLQRSSHHLFMNNLVACFRNFPTQEECCFFTES